MKIQLISSPNTNLSVIEQILANRGIKLKDTFHYLNTTDADINSPLAFGEDRMKQAAAAVFECVESNQKMLVLVD